MRTYALLVAAGTAACAGPSRAITPPAHLTPRAPAEVLPPPAAPPRATTGEEPPFVEHLWILHVKFEILVGLIREQDDALCGAMRTHHAVRERAELDRLVRLRCWQLNWQGEVIGVTLGSLWDTLQFIRTAEASIVEQEARHAPIDAQERLQRDSLHSEALRITAVTGTETMQWTRMFNQFTAELAMQPKLGWNDERAESLGIIARNRSMEELNDELSALGQRLQAMAYGEPTPRDPPSSRTPPIDAREL